jgi:hypothetical protein
LALAQAGTAAAGRAPDPFEDVEEILPERAPPRRVAAPAPDAAAPGSTAPGSTSPGSTSPATGPIAPGLTGPVDWVRDAIGADLSPAPLAMPEGTFVARRPGRIARVGSGHLVFVPDRTAGGTIPVPGEGPMLLLPNQAVGRLESALGASTLERVVLSGEVTVYGGRNYLLLSAFSRAETSETTPEAAPTAAAAPAAAQDGASASPAAADARSQDSGSIADDPDVAALLAELDASGPLRGIAPLPTAPLPTAPQAVAAATGAASGAASGVGSSAAAPASAAGTEPTRSSGADQAPVEGTYLVRRTGRLAMLASGALAIVFDNDQDTAGTSADAPLTLLPCRLLAGLEQAVGTRGDGQELIVSGRVFTFGQRGYLLPTLFQRPSRVGIDPVQ